MTAGALYHLSEVFSPVTGYVDRPSFVSRIKRRIVLKVIRNVRTSLVYSLVYSGKSL